MLNFLSFNNRSCIPCVSSSKAVRQFLEFTHFFDGIANICSYDAAPLHWSSTKQIDLQVIHIYMSEKQIQRNSPRKCRTLYIVHHFLSVVDLLSFYTTYSIPLRQKGSWKLAHNDELLKLLGEQVKHVLSNQAVPVILRSIKLSSQNMTSANS